MPPKCFISHKFHDGDALKHLLTNLPAHVEPYVFKEITVTPDRRVSDDLVSAIKDCTGVVYLKTETSLQSPWVSFERDFALRSQIPVYSYDPRTSRFKKDKKKPLTLNVYPQYRRADKLTVDRILRHLAEKRSFDLFDKENEADGLRRMEDYNGMITRNVEARLSAGGYIVVFISKNYVDNEGAWEHLMWMRERWPDRILAAIIPDFGGGQGLDELPEFPSAVKLYESTSSRGTPDLDWRRVDDLMVRIFYLVFQNMLAGSHR